MIEYFIPSHEQTKLERQKSRALVWFMYSIFLLFFLLIFVSLYPEPHFSQSDYGLPFAQFFVMSVLFVLKKYGLRTAGNVFSLGGLLIITVVINVFDQDTLFTKYGEEYFIAILVLVFISLFGTRKILAFSVIVIFLSSLRAFWYLQNTFPEQINVLIEAQVFFSVSLITISIILYYVTKFADEALANAQKDAEIKEEQNKALSIAQKRAKKSELLYRNIFNNLLGGFYKTDVNGNIVLVSPSALQITGFNEDEVLGMHLASFFATTEEQKEYFEETKTSGKIELFRAECKTKNKGNIFVETNATAVYDGNGQYEGIEGIFYDISGQRKMEIELEKHRHNLEKLVQEKTDEIEASNEELLSINEELTSQNDEVIRQKDYINKQNYELKEIQNKLKSVNHTLEEKVNIRTRELETSNKTLAKTVNELDRFVYSASHDLSAPLKSIMGLVHIAKLEDQEKKLEVHLNYIEKSILKQEEVISGLIQFSRNTRQDVSTEEFDLNNLINEVASDLRFISGYDDIRIKNNLKSEQNVISDRLRLQMIVTNLLSNSIKYRDFEKDNSHVIIDYEDNETYWSLILEDNGQGVEQEHLEKIFDMFFRAHEGSDGTGLGLFIVNEAVDKLSGKISVQSKVKKGTIFRLQFPKPKGR